MKLKIQEKYSDSLNLKIDHFKDAINIYQMEDLANKKFNLQTYSYYTTGSLNHETLEDNEASFKKYKIITRVLVDASDVDTSVELLGEKIKFPICIAPTSFHKLAHFNGELETADAATDLDTIMCLSIMTSVDLKVVAKKLKHKWMQIYIKKDLALVKNQIKEIEDAGYSVLVVTVDAPIMGLREMDNWSKFIQSELSKNTQFKSAESHFGQFFCSNYNPVCYFLSF